MFMLPFSWWAVVSPAVGQQFSLFIAPLLGARIVMTVLSGSFTMVGLPTFVCTMQLAYPSRRRSIILSMSSMAFFLFYHNFAFSSIYALLWLIPLVIATFNLKSRFLHSLEAVMLGHAVGTLLYLPFHVMPSAYWIALAPQALMERLLMAAMIFAVSVVISAILSKLDPYIRAARESRWIQAYAQSFSNHYGWQSAMGASAFITNDGRTSKRS